jgi:predicted RNA-binding protein YlqC (UPF0109 family)
VANSVQDLTVPALVASIARALVDLPEEVSVISTPGEDGTALRLRVDRTDVGKVTRSILYVAKEGLRPSKNSMRS